MKDPAIKKQRRKAAQDHTRKMQQQYSEEIQHSIAKTIIYNQKVNKDGWTETGKKAILQFLNEDTVSAINKAPEDAGKVAALNFASFTSPGGGFINGAFAQEEATCHESDLYNVLRTFTDFYAWNKDHRNNGLYCSRALYSPDIQFFDATGNPTRKADVITCASPNKAAGIRYKQFTEEENNEALFKRLVFIKDIAEVNFVDYLILGAFGCGAFKQDPVVVASMIRKIFTNAQIDKVIFAVPGNNKNTAVFKKEFSD